MDTLIWLLRDILLLLFLGDNMSYIGKIQILDQKTFFKDNVCNMCHIIAIITLVILVELVTWVELVILVGLVLLV